MSAGSPARACALVAGAIAAGLVVHLALHFVEPRLALTWSYAHLGRHPALPWAGAALVVGLPPAAALLWRTAAAARPLGRLPLPLALGGAAVLAAALVAAAVRFPPRPVSIDPLALVVYVREGRLGVARWHLTLWVLGGLWELCRPVVPSIHVFLRGTNALLGAVGLVALAGAARLLARTRGEAAAITLLAWTAFGTLQLAVGYLDVYPVVLALVAVYLWAALAAIAGRCHPAWPALVVSLGAFCYFGLVFLLPSYAVVAWTALRRPGGVRRVALAAAVAVAAAGLATVPGFGRPFAWAALAARMAAESSPEAGLSPDSSFLPLDFILSATHAREVAHTLLLVDGVGVLLVLVAGPWVVVRRGVDAALALLALALLPWLVYLLTIDPLWGAYSDWDVFSWGAAMSALLGAALFVRWGRDCPRPFAVLLGLALAASGVHLLARLNALGVDMLRHQAESPFHLRLP